MRHKRVPSHIQRKAYSIGSRERVQCRGEARRYAERGDRAGPGLHVNVFRVPNFEKGVFDALQRWYVVRISTVHVAARRGRNPHEQGWGAGPGIVHRHLREHEQPRVRPRDTHALQRGYTASPVF